MRLSLWSAARRCGRIAMLVIFGTVGCGMNAAAQMTFYTDESAFLSALDPAYGLIHESFENEAAWGSVRTTIATGTFSAPSVTARGITWTSNNSTSEVTTSNGAARSGDWGFYSIPHGSYDDPEPSTDCGTPGDCGDGFRVNSGGNLMYGLGGWVQTNTPYAKVGVFENTYTLYGSLCDVIDCDDLTVGTAPQFMGVIDPDGFTQIEFRELEGTGGDRKYIFADDFVVAVDAALVPLPAAWILLAPALCGVVTRRRNLPAMSPAAVASGARGNVGI